MSMVLRGKRVIPFTGVRYNADMVGAMDTVVCPPYDVISPQDREYYHQLSPYNFVRLVLGEEFESDTAQDNRFTRAKGYLDRWLSESVMTEETSQAVYVYKQDFVREGADLSVLGLICAVKLHEYSDQVILPHENTLSKPKSQLSDLLHNVKANLDSVYGLYEDQCGDIQSIFDRFLEEEPVCDVVDKDTVRHRVWKITESLALNKISAFFENKQIAIADGHHRYETALAFSKEAREAAGSTDAPLDSDYVLMTLANVYQDDLTVLPTHRVLSNLPPEAFLNLSNGLAEKFDVRPSTRKNLSKDMKKYNAIGVYINGFASVISVKSEVDVDIAGCEASQNLEVNLLHKLVIEELLGLTADDMRNQTYVVYTRDAKEALELVDNESAQIALLLNPVSVKSIMDIASAGEKMPQKSTYFYPKLLSGMVLRLLG